MRQRPPARALAPEVESHVPWFRDQVLAWFENNRREFPWREACRTPYEILVAEILLQRTRAAAAADAYLPFVARFPNWATLAEASEEDLRPHVEALGLGSVRIRTLLNVARAVQIEGDDIASRGAVERITGIGQYTANAVRLIVGGEDVPLLDANMARVLERYFGPRTYVDLRDDPYLHTLANRVAAGSCSLEVSWGSLILPPWFVGRGFLSVVPARFEATAEGARA